MNPTNTYTNSLGQYNNNSNEEQSNVLSDFQRQASRNVNQGSPSFSNTPQKGPLVLDQYKTKEERDAVERDKRPLQERLKEARDKKNPLSKNLLSEALNIYGGTDDDLGEIDYTVDPDSGSNLRAETKEEAKSLFKDTDYNTLDGVETMKELEKLGLTNTAQQLSNVPEIQSSVADAPWAETTKASGTYSDLDGVTQNTGKKFNAAGAASSALSVAGFAGEIAKAYSTDNENGSAGEFQQGFSLVASGASAGASIAGPWGAAVGAVVAGIVNVSDAVSDRKRYDEKQKKLAADKRTQAKDRRMRDYLANKSKTRNDALMAYNQAQLGYINLDNY